MTRKIETQMIQSIIDNKDWKNSNTEVLTDCFVARIYLHGHLIAEYTYRGMKLEVNNCGYATRTTKSRLNALIKFVDGGLSGIYQRKGQWFLKTTSQNDVEINDNTWITI
tara:strand:- start:137 stop:466 length:330 start_codon:yes stop_codon:yes gene_type:complete